MVCLRFIDVWFVVVLSTFDLSSFYRHDVVRCLVIIFYLCGGKINLMSRRYSIMIC